MRYLIALLAGLLFAGNAWADGIPFSISPPFTPGSIAGGIVNAKTQFGLVCDGVTDNAGVFTNIATYAAANPYSTIYFPPAAQQCLTSATINAQSNTTYWAYPGTVTLGTPNRGSSNGNLFFNASGVSNVLVYGLGEDCGISVLTADAACNTTFNSDHVVFERMNVANSIGIAFNVSTSVTYSGVRNSTLTNIGTWGEAQVTGATMAGTALTIGAVTSGTIRVGAIVHGTSVPAGTHILSGSGLNWVTDNSATIASPTPMTIVLVHQGVAFCCGTEANQHDDFVTGTSFNTIGLDSVSMQSVDNILIANNTFNVSGGIPQQPNGVCGASVYVNQSTGATIVGNVATGACGNTYDLVSVRGLTLTGNVSNLAGGCGMSLAAIDGGTVTGNTLNNSNQLDQYVLKDGICLGGSLANNLPDANANLLISGNTATGAPKAGATLYGIDQIASPRSASVKITNDNKFDGNLSGAYGPNLVGPTTHHGSVSFQAANDLNPASAIAESVSGTSTNYSFTVASVGNLVPGSISYGNSGGGVPDYTTVAAISGTTVYVDKALTGSPSSTSMNFYPPVQLCPSNGNGLMVNNAIQPIPSTCLNFPLQSGWSNNATEQAYVTSPVVNVTGAANSDGVRNYVSLTVDSTTDFTTSNQVWCWGIGGTTEANGTFTGEQVDSTHIVLYGVTYTNAFVSGGFCQYLGSRWTTTANVAATNGVTVESGDATATAVGSALLNAVAPLAPINTSGTRNVVSLFNPSNEDIQIFTATGTWTKPTFCSQRACETKVSLYGPGGPGGGGGMQTLGTATSGGGGGGGGEVRLNVPFLTSDLSATETVTIGTQGTGGTGATSIGNGANGVHGTNTTFGNHLTAYCGGTGGGGTTTGGGGGAGAGTNAGCNDGSNTLNANLGTNGTAYGNASASGGFGANGVGYSSNAFGLAGSGGGGGTAAAAFTAGIAAYGIGGASGGPLLVGSALAGGGSNPLFSGGQNGGAAGGSNGANAAILGGNTLGVTGTNGTSGGGGNAAGNGGTGGTGGTGAYACGGSGGGAGTGRGGNGGNGCPGFAYIITTGR